MVFPWYHRPMVYGWRFCLRAPINGVWMRIGGAHRAPPILILSTCGCSLSSIGWRRGLGSGGAFLLVSPLGPLPTRSSRGEDGELDAALSGDGKVPGTRGQACPRHG